MKRRNFLRNTSLVGMGILIYPSFKSYGSGSISSEQAEQTKANAFWDLFGNDYRENCKAWMHNLKKNPVIPSGTKNWKKMWTANPDILELNGKTLVYYRGNGTKGNEPDRHDRIGVAEIRKVTGDEFLFEDLNNGNFIVDVGPKGSFDDGDVLDPGVIIFNGKVFLYYSAVGTGPDSIGLAVSDDGVHFEKYGEVLIGRSPDVLIKDDKMYLVYQLDKGEGYRGFYLAVSEDGYHFQPVSDQPVFSSGDNSWDKYIATARFHMDENGFYILYGGSPDMNDQPDYFGLARSQDLFNWEKHPGNPIFGLSAKGEEDGGAIWFPALIETPEHYVIIYEGSRGRYSWELTSQICMSSIKK